MALKYSRYSALIYAILLAVFETYIHLAGSWDAWPMWTIDYVIVLWLIYAFIRSRNMRYIHSLTTAWAFTLGIFYMSVFMSLELASVEDVRPGQLIATTLLVAVMTILAALGTATAAYAQHSTQHLSIETPVANGQTENTMYRARFLGHRLTLKRRCVFEA